MALHRAPDRALHVERCEGAERIVCELLEWGEDARARWRANISIVATSVRRHAGASLFDPRPLNAAILSAAWPIDPRPCFALRPRLYKIGHPHEGRTWPSERVMPQAPTKIVAFGIFISELRREPL